MKTLVASVVALVLVGSGVAAVSFTQNASSTVGMNRSKDPKNSKPLTIPKSEPAVRYPLPGIDSFRIVNEAEDPQFSLKNEMASLIINEAILPNERLEFFAPYQTKGRAFERFQGTVQSVEETATGWKITVEITLLPVKSNKGFAISTFVETYEVSENGVKLIDSQAGTKYASDV